MQKKQLSINRCVFMLLLLSIGVSVYAGGGNKETYYSKAVAHAVPSSVGKVWVGVKDGTDSQGWSNPGTAETYDWTKKEAESAPTYTYNYYIEESDPEGYTFAGWYRNSECTDSKTSYRSFSEDVPATTNKEKTDLEYWAKWNPNTYTISFNGNSSTKGSVANVGATYDQDVTLAANGYRKHQFKVMYDANGGTCSRAADSTLYSFEGWNTNSSGTGKDYSAGETLTKPNFTPTNGGSFTLYANWSDTPANTSVTLPTPTKDGYLFEGWYVGSIAVANKIETATYTPESNVTLVANWVDKYDLDIRGVSTTISNDAWNLTDAFNFVRADKEHMTVNIGNADVISYDMEYNTITAKAIGSSTISFTQNTSATVKEGTSSVWTITVDSVANTLAVSGTEFTKYVDDEITSVRSSQNSNGNITTTSSNENLAYYDIDDNTIYIPNSDAQTLPFDDVTITISQAATTKYKFKKHTITLTVQKYPTSFTGSEYNSLKVDDEQTADYTYTNTSASKPTASNDDDFYYTIDNISYTNSAKNKKYNELDSLVRFNPNDKQITALNAGTGKITFHQKETYKYTGATTSFNVTVSKYENAVSCSTGSWTSTINFDEEITLGSNNSAAPLIVSRTSGDADVTTYDAVNKKIVANYREGNATWSVSQAEDYKYKAATAQTLTVTVGTLPSPGCMLLGNQSDTQHGMYGNTYHQHTWDVEHAAGVVRFEISKDAAGIDQGYKVQQYLDNDGDGNWTWENVTDYKNDHSTSWGDWKSETLDVNAKGIRFMMKGSVNNYVRNVSVTRKTYVDTKNTSGATITSMDMPVKLNTGSATSATFYVDYSTCDNVIKLGLDNPHITFANGETTYQFETDDSGRKAITLTYNSAVVEDIEATVTIYTRYEHETLTVNAQTVTKHTPTITWPGTTEFEVGDNIANGFTVEDENGDPIEGGTWSFVSKNEEVIKIVDGKIVAQELDEDTKTAKIVGTLTAGEYDNFVTGSSEDITLTVNRKDNVITVSGASATMLMDATMSGITVSSTNSDGPAYTVSTETSEADAVFDLGEGTVESKHTIGEFSWTIHQDADGTYKAANTVFSVKVQLDDEDTSEKIYMYQSGSNGDAGWKINEFDEIDLVPVGVATRIWFDAKQEKAKDKNMWAEHYVSGEWSMFDSKAKSSVLATYNASDNQFYKETISSSATKVRFNSDDNNKVYVRNVKIECSGHILTDAAANRLVIDRQEGGVRPVYYDEEGLGTLTVYCGLAKNSGDVKLVCDNSHFTFGDTRASSLTLVENSATATFDSIKIAVHFTPEALRNETAHVVIYNKVYRKEIEIVGVYAKYPQEVSWNIGTRLKLDAENEISNAATATLGNAVTYTSSNSEVIEVTEGGTKLLAKAAGEATITATSAGNAYYEAAEGSIDVEVIAVSTPVEVDENSDWTEDINELTPVTIKENADITISGEVKVYSLTIETGAKVTVESTGGLTVNDGSISGTNGENLVLKAGTEGATKGQTGYLRVSPLYTGVMPEVKVEMYSAAYHNKNAESGNKSKYQCVGVPISDEGVRANTIYPSGTWVYTWNEATEEWTSSRTTMTFEAFKGFETTQKLNADGKPYLYSGHIVSGSTSTTIDLDFTSEDKGYNLLANSYTAPIDIASFAESDFVNAQKTIYILNAGTKNESLAPADGYDAPGQWVGVPIYTAEELAEAGLPRMIPSMQGFWVRATGAEAQLKLDYTRLVWNVDYSGIRANKPLRAPKRSAEANDEEPITCKFKMSITAEEGNDFLYMLESERYDATYEDGYDAYKLSSGGVEIFAVEDDAELGVDATNSMAGTQICVRTGEETEYTIRFSHVSGEKQYALKDYDTNKIIDITEGLEYTFKAVKNAEIIGRFEIVESAKAPTITTGAEEVETETKVQKYVKDYSLYILKDGVLYNALGERVR